VKKKVSGEAYNVNKQTIYIEQKSTNESRVQYSPEPARGTPFEEVTGNRTAATF